jgi:hypothetical protein
MFSTEQEAVGAVLEELQDATDRLIPAASAGRLDIDEIEKALAERQRAVGRLGELIARCPEAFTRLDVERVRESVSSGRMAAERLIEIRRGGWAAATELSQNQYILRTIGNFGAGSPD